MCITAFQKRMHYFRRNIRVVQNRFQITLYTAYRCFQFVCDILGKLSFQSCLFFFLSDIDDGNFKGMILKDDALYGNERAFLSICNENLFSSLWKFPSFLFKKSVIGASSGMENTSSVDARLWSDMVLAY